MTIVAISCDPCHPRIDVYPHQFCRKLRQGYRDKKPVYLGDRFFRATVFMPDGDSEYSYQTTPAEKVGNKYKPPGYREVKWVEINYDKLTVPVKIYQNDFGTYHFCKDGDYPYNTKTIDVDFNLDHLENSECDHDDDDPDNIIVWEWCSIIEETNKGKNGLFNVAHDDWKLYTPEINKDITESYKLRVASHDLTLGCRNYLIIFSSEGGVYSRQVDPVFRKSRLVRRISMHRDSYDTLYRRQVAKNKGKNPNKDIMNGEINDCAICLESFKDTSHLEIITLPCGHTFHRVCIQPSADMDKPCCYCKQEVDWLDIMDKANGSVGSLDCYSR